MAQPEKIIVGLGNPGPDYSFNRHNIGFMAVDPLASSPHWRRKFNGEILDASLGGVPCLLLKPLTYMNLSGKSVAEAMRFYKLTPTDVIVLHDDIDLLAGKVKVKQGGGNGGHNGLKSIDAHIGPDYWRVRFGVGHPGHRDEVSDYVLGNFAKADREWLEPVLGAVAAEFKELLSGDEALFMSRVARRVNVKDKTTKT
ncbi:MAG: aminoacyl-tRNA hydrolase [Alphaproteobacteria bacterium]|nr:aminoacyl-tRNA hydrolase [Alphaproteobacteria bacterium]